MNGEGLLEGLRFTTSCQVIAAPLHSWRGARGSGGEVCASFDAWPNFQKNLDLVARITDIAHDKGCAASQLALAWVMAQGDEGHGPLLSVEHCPVQGEP